MFLNSGGFHVCDIDQYALGVMTEFACGVEVRQVLVDTRLHTKNSFLVLFVEVV